MVVIHVKNLSALAAAIGSKRRSLAMSQEQLADQSGVSQATINMIESGKRLPSLITLLSVLNELHLAMSLEEV